MTHEHSVLLVEDDADLREALAAVLVEEDLRVKTARNGLEALQRLRAGERPCLILLDLMMPVMNGWEFLAHKRDDPALASIAVVIVSAWKDTTTGIQAKAIVPKPIQVSKLLETIRQHFFEEQQTESHG